MTCLIGIADSRIICEKRLSWDTNKIGGNAILPYGNKSGLQPKCVFCGRPLLLVVQLYCPLQGSPFHRLMYMFACASPQCWNKSDSWVVYRYHLLDPTSAAQTDRNIQKSDTGIDDWGAGNKDDWGVGDKDDWGADGAEDWGDEAVDIETDSAGDRDTEEHDANREKQMKPNSCPLFTQTTGQSTCSNFSHAETTEICQESGADDPKQDSLDELEIQTMNIHDSESDSSSDSHVIPEDVHDADIDKNMLTEVCKVSDLSTPHDTILSYYLNVFEEPGNLEEDSAHVNKLLKEYEKKEGYRVCDSEAVAESGGGGKAEGYEKTSVLHKDMTFHKFLKRVSLCSQQCIRYEWSGKPLCIKNLSTSEVPTRCCHCGGELVFEFQLMPALVNYLKAAESTGPVIEFGTVLVFTCKQSCWEEGATFKTEHVIVQSDPDQECFK